MKNNSVEETKKLNEQSRANAGVSSNVNSKAGMTSSTSGNTGTSDASNSYGMSSVSNTYSMSSSTNDSALEETKRLNKQSKANKNSNK